MGVVPLELHDGRLTDFTGMYAAPPHVRVGWVRKGVRAAELKDMIGRMGVAQEALLKQLKLSAATVNRKARRDEGLSSEDSERVMGVARLIGQVQTMVEESGDPEGFDAARWVARWLETPLPALGGETPGSYMDTMQGQAMISNLLAMAQSGAYA